MAFATFAMIFGLPALALLIVSIAVGLKQVQAASAQTELTMNALREQIRPVLTFVRENPKLTWRAPAQRLLLTNTGAGAAFHTEVELFKGTFDESTSLGTYFGFEPFVVPPGQALLLAFPTYMAYSILVVYKSVKGENFASTISFPDGEMRVAFQENVRKDVSKKPFLASNIGRGDNGPSGFYAGPAI